MIWKTVCVFGFVCIAGCSDGTEPEHHPSDAELGFPEAFAYTSRDKEGVGIFLRSKEGDRLLTSEFKSAEAPAWSPDGRKIAFHSNDEGHFDIYVMDVASGKSQRLTTDESNDRHPDWSPDGKTIAFVSDRRKPNSAGDVYLMNADGSNIRRLTEEIDGTAFPAWSPDGKQIAFSASHSPDTTALIRGTKPGKSGIGQSDIYIAGADGSRVRKLTDGHAVALYPAWSPDGKQLVFSSLPKDTTHWQLAIVNADGTNSRHLTWADGDNLCPNWSPHKAKILFHSIDSPQAGSPNRTAELWVVNFDSTGMKQLSFSASDNYFAAWRPVARKSSAVRGSR